jgi:hypothetical protein
VHRVRIECAANICHVTDATGETDAFAIAKERQNHRNVRLMSCAQPRIICDVNVARTNAGFAVLVNKMLGRVRQSLIEHWHTARRMRQTAPATVEQFASKIICRANHR